MTEYRLAQESAEQGAWLFRWRSYLPLLLLPLAIVAMATKHYAPVQSRYELLPGIICLVISFGGIAARGMAIGYAQPGTSGRNTRKQVADHLNTVGMYSICRHPLYLGNILLALGLMIFTQSVFFILFATLAYWLFYEKITAAEERFIAAKFSEEYQVWAGKTPYLFPAFRQWVTPQWSFNWKAAARSELYSLTSLSISFLILDSAQHYFRNGSPRPNVYWVVFSAASLVCFFLYRIFRK